MILYRPTDSDVHNLPIEWRPRSAFLMLQLGTPLSDVVQKTLKDVSKILSEQKFRMVDANSATTGKDFLLKIWLLALSVPVGIAIVHEEITHSTMANIFYELGLMHAYGKETIVIKVGDVAIPSDFVRTEYVPYDRQFRSRFRSFVKGLQEQANYYVTISEQVEHNPLLAIDYLRRAYLLSGDKSLRDRANKIYATEGFTERAKNSVETLLISF